MNQDHKKDSRNKVSNPRHNVSHNASHNAAKKKQQHFHINIHIILLAVILLIAGFSAYRLYKWNKGIPSDYDPDFQTTDFDTEAMDNIIPLAPDKLEGHEDDGVTTILCLGDDPFSLKLDADETIKLSEQIAARTGATVYDGSFTGTTIAAQLDEYNDGYILDAFSFSYVANSLASGDFDIMKTAATYSYDESFEIGRAHV